jgi:hypothetical protein
MQEYG